MSEKYYQLGTYTAEQWCEIHNELTGESAGLSNIPDRCVECYDDKVHSLTRGTFLLTDEEAEILSNDPRIKFINVDYALYPETYRPNKDDIHCATVVPRARYAKPIKNIRSRGALSSIQSTDINRAGYNLLRPVQKEEYWLNATFPENFGSFVIPIPNGWIQTTDPGVSDLVSFPSFAEPAPNYTIEINGPAYINEMSHDIAYSATSNGPVASLTIGLTIENSLGELIYDATVQVENSGTENANAFIGEQGLLLPNAETYTVSFDSQINYISGTVSNFFFAIGNSIALGNTDGVASTIWVENINQLGDGSDVDVVVCDEGCWTGHPEFQSNPTSGSLPRSLKLGNPLSASGTCMVLDLLLDSPYYLDPDYFDANPATRLLTRWDGTVVPVESVARSWWSNSANRSTTFNTLHPTAGIVTGIPTTYTRLNTSGSNSAKPNLADGEHGTPCGALTYGRTHGWAYNSNKWMLNTYGIFGCGFEQTFDIQKIFHNTKPINPKYGTKNPTISSNSWGFRSNKDPVGNTYYYNFRGGAATAYTSEFSIPWLVNMGVTGDNGRWSGEVKTNSYTGSLDELIESGVIFVAAAGNSNQKTVNSDHPDFNNYIATQSGQALEQTTFSDIGLSVYGTTNRRGFPAQGGMYDDPTTGQRVYPVIAIGALDDSFRTETLEQKVNYSNRGNSIDVYAPGDKTMAANAYYVNPTNTLYPDSYDQYAFSDLADCVYFTGTSAACPVACGFIATILQYNRGWTWQDVKTFLQSLETLESSGQFYVGTESTIAIDNNWLDYNSLEGGDARVIYQPLNIQQTTFPKRKLTFSAIQKFDRGE